MTTMPDRRKFRHAVANRPPLVSVVMPVRNGMPFVDGSILSIVHQSHADLELIVVDDGSTDDTPGLARRHQATDPRIRLVTQAAAGVATALNKGCALARGTFIARMDADDLAVPDRLERQVGFLLANPDIAVVGSSITIIDASGIETGRQDFSVRPDDIAFALRAGVNPVAHPSVVMRKEAFRASGGYDVRFEGSEDYELWLRMSVPFRFANLTAPLLRYRVHAAGASAAGRLHQALAVRVARALHRPGAPSDTGGAPITWSNYERLGLAEADRAQLAIPVASVAMRQIGRTDARDRAGLGEATTALSMCASPLQPRAVQPGRHAAFGVISPCTHMPPWASRRMGRSMWHGSIHRPAGSPKSQAKRLSFFSRKRSSVEAVESAKHSRNCRFDTKKGAPPPLPISRRSRSA